MIDFSSILKVAVPIVGAILSDNVTTDTSPKKTENIYNEIVPMTINTIAKVLAEDDSDNNILTQQQTQLMRPPIEVSQIHQYNSPYEIAKNKKYKYNF